MAILAQQIRRYEKEYFVYVDGDPERRALYVKEWADAHGKVNAALAKIRGGMDGAFSAADIGKVGALQAASDFYGSEMKKIFEAVDRRSVDIRVAREMAALEPPAKPKPAAPAPAEPPLPVMFTPTEVNDMITEGKDRFSAEVIKGVVAMEKAKVAETLALAAGVGNSFNRLLAGMLTGLGLGVLVAVALTIGLPRMAANAIERLSTGAEQISMGKLEQPFDAGGIVEFDQLADALNRMRLATQLMVERMRNRMR